MATATYHGKTVTIVHDPALSSDPGYPTGVPTGTDLVTIRKPDASATEPDRSANMVVKRAELSNFHT